MLGLYEVPRLQGTAALQVREDHSSLDHNLEGVRSLGAVLIDPSFVCRNKAWANVGPSLGSAAARDRSPPKSMFFSGRDDLRAVPFFSLL